MVDSKAKINYEFLYLLILIFPIISPNLITLTFKGTGKEIPFMNQMEERFCPDEIIIDGILKDYSTCKYKFENKIVTIKMKFEKKINNFYRMFAKITNIIEVDLSQFDTSLVNNMANMFENCTSLIFANLSNLNLSSVKRMEYMFINCISLKSLDFTNIKISRIPYYKNIFFNCKQLKYNNSLDKNIFSLFKNNKRTFNENSYFISNNKKRRVEDEEGGGINQGMAMDDCGIEDMFEPYRDCVINIYDINDQIVEGLKTQEYRDYIITSLLLDNKEASTEEEDYHLFSITYLNYENVTNVGGCEEILRMEYNISREEEILIYKHIILGTNNKIISIGFELFCNKSFLDINLCQNTQIKYNIPVEINENELYKYNPSSEYYHDNCTYKSNTSLYDRKNEFNEKELSLCQKNCEFHSYNITTKSVECICPPINSNINTDEELLFKFELLEEEKNKCLLGSNIIYIL